MRTQEVEFYVAIDEDGGYDINVDRDCIGDSGGINDSYVVYKVLLTLPVPSAATIKIDASAAQPGQPIDPSSLKVTLKIPD